MYINDLLIHIADKMFNEKIKKDTQEAHQELEKQVIIQLKNIRTPEDYGKVLLQFYRYFSQLEQAIAPYITENILPDYAGRRKAGRLRDDLETTGYTAAATLPAVALPVIDSPLTALGALYVMEGSLMGGPIIIKMLQEKCGISQGVSFFSGYGADTPAKWQTFREHMNRQVDSPDAGEAVIAAANDTFKKFSFLFRPA